MNRFCPQCHRVLKEVLQSPDSYLNADQFSASKAGDYYCEHCPPNDRALRNLYCYWWEHELNSAPSESIFNASTFKFIEHLARQKAWSEATFGPGPRTAGVMDHIRRELVEIEASPEDVEEWIDVAILALDGAWRAGATPDKIIFTLVAKQAKNEKRKWPDWRTADPNEAIQHIKENGE